MFKISKQLDNPTDLSYSCLLFGWLYLFTIMFRFCMYTDEEVREKLGYLSDDTFEEYDMKDNFVLEDGELKAQSFVGFAEGVRYVYNSGGYIPENHMTYISLGYYITTVDFPEDSRKDVFDYWGVNVSSKNNNTATVQ